MPNKLNPTGANDAEAINSADDYSRSCAGRSQGRGGRGPGRGDGGRGSLGRGSEGRGRGRDMSRFPRSVSEHNEESVEDEGGASTTALNIRKFCESLSKYTSTDTLVRIVSGDNELWNQSFEAAAEAMDMERFVPILLKVVLKLPNQSSVSVSPERLLPVLLKLLRLAADADSLRLFLDVFPKLRGESFLIKMSNKVEVLKLIEKLRVEINKATQRLISSYRSVADIVALVGEINIAVDDFKVLISTSRVSGTERDCDRNSEELPYYMLWSTSPTLKWLLDAQWLKHEPLREQYESVEQYAATMKSLWTTLSFYWGAAAVSPRCHHNDNNQACLAPLLSNPRSNKYCTIKVYREEGKVACGMPALYGCFRSGHDAICASCFTKKQELIIGRPAQRDSSTDIYDASIRTLSVRNDSVVLNLCQTLSRKPPEASINWPTTYRLQPSSLVALVNLAVSKAPLKPEQPIFLGEIISSHNDDREEYSRRSRGELSVRLLTKQDCIYLASNNPSFGEGSNVAVIDLRVFVPEVVSVLATLCSPSFEQSLQRLKFAGKLLGLLEDANTPRLLNSNGSLITQVAFAISHSDIKCIKRFSEEDKQLLVQRISSIPSIRSMDTTQREALCAALQSSVHCTQGPPGTGKVNYIFFCQ